MSLSDPKSVSLVSVCLAVLAFGALPLRAAPTGDSSPQVRAVLFFAPDAAPSRDFFAFYLPGLIERWGQRLEFAGIDISEQAGAGVYRAAAKRWDLPPVPDGAPVVLVGDRVLVGLLAIAVGLGDDFERLASDPRAASWPSIPGLDALLPEGIQAVAARVSSEGVVSAAAPPADAGLHGSHESLANALAVAVLIGMVAAIIHALTRLWRRGAESARAGAAWLLPIALLAGLGISAYTGYTALAHAPLVCGPIGSCAEVQASEYAKILGVPLGVIGVAGYLLIMVTWQLARRWSPQGGGWYWVAWAIALLGVLFSLRLTALEPFVIGATCLWCLGSAVCMTLVFWLLSGLVRAGDGSRGHADRTSA